MTIAIGALVLILSLAGGALLSRWYVTPTAKRLAPEVNDWGWCPAEEQTRLHRYDRDDSRTCWTCETRTPGGAR